MPMAISNVSDCVVNIDGYISEHGYVHSGGITGLYILYPVTGSYVADIAGNTINGKITFLRIIQTDVHIARLLPVKE